LKQWRATSAFSVSYQHLSVCSTLIVVHLLASHAIASVRRARLCFVLTHSWRRNTHANPINARAFGQAIVFVPALLIVHLLQLLGL
jgi:hypothetical protein